MIKNKYLPDIEVTPTFTQQITLSLSSILRREKNIIFLTYVILHEKNVTGLSNKQPYLYLSSCLLTKNVMLSYFACYEHS